MWGSGSCRNNIIVCDGIWTVVVVKINNDCVRVVADAGNVFKVRRFCLFVFCFVFVLFVFFGCFRLLCSGWGPGIPLETTGKTANRKFLKLTLCCSAAQEKFVKLLFLPLFCVEIFCVLNFLFASFFSFLYFFPSNCVASYIHFLCGVLGCAMGFVNKVLIQSHALVFTV